MARSTVALIARKCNGPLIIETAYINEIRPDEALVEIHAVGICHADISCLDGAGVVKEVGRNITHISPGDKVLLSYNYCGHCVQCSQGHPAYCLSMLSLNFEGRRPDGSFKMMTQDKQPLYSNHFGQSSFARLAVVSGPCMVKVAAETPLELFAPLGCGLQTGAGAIFNTLNIPPGATLAIFGVGSVGMSAMMAAKIREARVIIAIDLIESRLELARKLGATHTIHGSDSGVAEQLAMICQSDGVMFALDTTGSPTIIERMIKSLGTRGRAASVGAPPPDKLVSLNVLEHLTRGREYVGCNQGDSIAHQMIPFLIEQYSLGKYPLNEIVKFYDIDDFDLALTDMKSGKTIKPVLVWTTNSGCNGLA
ncbi:hypothetical protein N7520_011691 [Penicillium odoratum]|uniref:uncharacterized protein n=1 Tax=Penicillium odoratum TaxID=1167516 RepID=UPI0025467AF5|nr:uncharacterized protein N7520_011691 [Penicillium odoratum]KAJ5746509.1 hypothetical protein N7520_011691 [Penicillium odoratum]